MILLITFRDEKTNEIWVSHGIDLDSDNIVILPEMRLSLYDKAKYDCHLMDYVIE